MATPAMATVRWATCGGCGGGGGPLLSGMFAKSSPSSIVLSPLLEPRVGSLPRAVAAGRTGTKGATRFFPAIGACLPFDGSGGSGSGGFFFSSAPRRGGSGSPLAAKILQRTPPSLERGHGRPALFSKPSAWRVLSMSASVQFSFCCISSRTRDTSAGSCLLALAGGARCTAVRVGAKSSSSLVSSMVTAHSRKKKAVPPAVNCTSRAHPELTTPSPFTPPSERQLAKGVTIFTDEP